MNTLLLALTSLSLLVAVACAVIAARAAHGERVRSDARIAALRIAAGLPPLTAEPPTVPTAEASLQTTTLALAGVLVAIIMVAAAVALWPAAPSAARNAHAAVSPLELLSLTQANDGRRLQVTGVVQNPADAPAREGLAVTLVVLDAHGTVIGRTRTPLGSPRLSAGAASPFAVALDGAEAAARYSVSFETAGHAAPHVDRRGEPVTTAAHDGRVPEGQP